MGVQRSLGGFECGMVLPVAVGAAVTPRQRGALRDDQPAIPGPQKQATSHVRTLILRASVRQGTVGEFDSGPTLDELS